MHGRVDAWMGGCMDAWTGGCMDDGWAGGWVAVGENGRMVGFGR